MPDVNGSSFQLPQLYPIMHSLTVLALSLNFFTIYVILYHTPMQMKPFSRYLLFYEIVCTTTDLCLMWLIAPWFGFPALGLLPTGPLTAIGVPTEPQVVAGFIILAFIIISMGELFFKRQQSILPGWSRLKMENWKAYVWHSYIFSWVPIALVVPSYIIYNNECDKQKIVRTFPSLRALVYHKDFLCLAENYGPMVIYFLVFIATQTLTILFTLVISMVYHLYNFDERVSQKTRKMQKSLVKILIIQTVVPLGFMFVPMVVCFHIVRTGRSDLLDWNPWLVLIISLHGPCSTFLILVLYSPYLKYMKRLLRLEKEASRSVTRVTVTSVVPSKMSMGWTEKSRRNTMKI